MKDKTIYLADDDGDDRFFMKEAVKAIDEDVKIVEAENGAELLDVLEDEKIPDPAMIVVDANMPIMNGLETISAIKSNPDFADVPAVMVSTSSEQSLANEAIQRGADNFFTKPYSLKGYLELARSLIYKYLLKR
jgi:CheY-like chemotaxis protein